MLKLTRANPDSSVSVYIAAKYVVAMESYDHGTTAIWTVNQSYLVTETAEHIMAMPEMLNEMHPAVVMTAHDPGGYTSFRDYLSR
jgi:hypothetical protein